MLRLSKLSDYAIVILASMADRRDDSHTAHALAERTSIPRPTVAKLLKRLGDGRLVKSVRGRNGGYFLARPPESISVTEVIETIEGRMAITECELDDGSCQLESVCRTRRHWHRINHAIREALDDVHFDQLIELHVPGQMAVPDTGFKTVAIKEDLGGR